VTPVWFGDATSDIGTSRTCRPADPRPGIFKLECTLIGRDHRTPAPVRRLVELRVPYPMGFFAKQIDGRIDDPSAGWKARGLWVTSGNRTPVHIEGLDAPVRGAPTLRRNQAHSW
jgi:hypothetical protein